MKPKHIIRKGISIIELLVAVGLLGLILAFTFTFTGKMSKNTATIIKQKQQEKELTEIKSILQRYVSTADVPTVDEPNSIETYRFSFYIDGRNDVLECNQTDKTLTLTRGTDSPWVLTKNLDTCKFTYQNTINGTSVAAQSAPVTSPTFNALELDMGSDGRSKLTRIGLSNYVEQDSTTPTATPSSTPTTLPYPGGVPISRP